MKKGFTLIEVLVALAIVAIALVAVIKVTEQSVRSTTSVREKIAAHWVAMNVIADVQSGFIKTDEVNELAGMENMLQLMWQWHLTLEKAPDGMLQRMTVTVMPQNSTRVVESLVGFP